MGLGSSPLCPPPLAVPVRATSGFGLTPVQTTQLGRCLGLCPSARLSNSSDSALGAEVPQLLSSPGHFCPRDSMAGTSKAWKAILEASHPHPGQISPRLYPQSWRPPAERAQPGLVKMQTVSRPSSSGLAPLPLTSGWGVLILFPVADTSRKSMLSCPHWEPVLQGPPHPQTNTDAPIKWGRSQWVLWIPADCSKLLEFRGSQILVSFL